MTAKAAGIQFSDEGMREFNEMLQRYPQKQAAILSALHIAQREFGYISPDVIKYVARLLGLSTARIHGVVTFYTMLNQKPVGKYHLQVCRNVSCSLLGAFHLIEYISGKLDIEPGETTPDGRFTLSLVECLGSCGTAPVMQVNDDYIENLTEEKIDGILNREE
jgi:NADH-quinone oxidoreductase E subunit